jgi:hypothetical protein
MTLKFSQKETECLELHKKKGAKHSYEVEFAGA